MTELDVRHLHNQLKSGLVAWRRGVAANSLINVNIEDPTSGNNRTNTLNFRHAGDLASSEIHSCHQLMSSTKINPICNSFPVGSGLHKVAQSHAATLPVASTGPI